MMKKLLFVFLLLAFPAFAQVQAPSGPINPGAPIQGNAGAVTPSDTITFAAQRAIGAVCTVAGNVKFGWSDGSTWTVPLNAGLNQLSWAVNQVFATGTTATCTYAVLK
jgi:spore coat protein U-like protein